VFGGAGYAFNEIEVAGLPGAEVDDSFAAHAGAGAEFPLNESIALYVDGRYFYSEPEVNFSFFGEDKIQVHSILVGGGVIIRF
jgi:opacity protein-like surface antigen